MRTHNLSKRAVADLRLCPRGHWDWSELVVDPHTQKFAFVKAACTLRIENFRVEMPSVILDILSVVLKIFLRLWRQYQDSILN